MEEQPQPQEKLFLWCHECQDSVGEAGDPKNPLCPRCGSDFVEEEPEGHQHDDEGDDDFENDDDDEEFQGHDLFQTLLRMMQANLGARGGRQGGAGAADGEGGVPGGPFRFHVDENGLRADAGEGADNPDGLPMNFMQLLNQIASGRLGDYALGDTGFDNIITQLMEQNTGTKTPATEEQINSLASHPISQKEKDEKSECSVCREEFGVGDKATSLPCQHLFHSDCIVPWLKESATCPVCRASIAPEEKEEPKEGKASAPEART